MYFVSIGIGAYGLLNFDSPGPPQLGAKQYRENGLVKPPRLVTRALSPAGMFGGKAPLHLAAQKSRPHAPLAPKRSAPAYFICLSAPVVLLAHGKRGMSPK
jgi:hypothetical protein